MMGRAAFEDARRLSWPALLTLRQNRSRLARLLGAALGQTRRQEDRVHGPGAGPAHGIEGDGVLLEQPVEHAPGECAQGAPALQRQRETLDRPARWLRA